MTFPWSPKFQEIHVGIRKRPSPRATRIASRFLRLTMALFAGFVFTHMATDKLSHRPTTMLFMLWMSVIAALLLPICEPIFRTLIYPFIESHLPVFQRIFPENPFMDPDVFTAMKDHLATARKEGREGFDQMIHKQIVLEGDPTRRTENLRYLTLRGVTKDEVLESMKRMGGWYLIDEAQATYEDNIHERVEMFAIWATYSLVIFGVITKGVVFGALLWILQAVVKMED